MMNPSELLLTSSVLILAVLALRHFGRGRLSRRLCYGLWLVVLLRLLVPVSLPSPTSVLNLPAAGIRLIQHRPEFLGPSVFPVSHRTLLLQTAEHGDDCMLGPARLRRQPLSELGNGRLGLAPELVHQFPFAVRQRNVCHRRSLLPYGRQLFT